MKISDPNFCVQWHITNKCSQRCKQCYLFQAENNVIEQELDIAIMSVIVEDVLKTAKELKANALFVLTGGDPMLYPKFWELLDTINKLSDKFKIKSTIDILGNPFYIDSSSASELKKYGIRKFQLSLDGLQEKHDILRSQGGYQDTFRAMQILKEADIKTTCMFTLSKFNAPDLISVMEEVAKKGFDAFAFARLCRPSGWTSEQYQEQMFTPNEYKNFLTQINDVHGRLFVDYPKTRFVLKDHLWELFFYEKRSEKEKIKLLKMAEQGIITGGCSLGIAGVSILADGIVYACRRFYSPIGKVPDQNLLDLFINSSELNEYRNINKYIKCKQCPLLHSCRGCGAVAFGITGSFFGPDPQCWFEP